MEKEDLDFITNLSKELTIQENFSTAKPLYWGIKDRFKVYGETLNNPDGIELIFDGEETSKEYILQLLEEHDKDIDWGFFENKEEYLKSEDFYYLNYFYEINYIDVGILEFEYIYKIVEGTLFLTLKAAEQHLKINNYHYTEFARCYCMHAWRSPEFERLLNIIENVEWENM